MRDKSRVKQDVLARQLKAHLEDVVFQEQSKDAPNDRLLESLFIAISEQDHVIATIELECRERLRLEAEAHERRAAAMDDMLRTILADARTAWGRMPDGPSRTKGESALHKLARRGVDMKQKLDEMSGRTPKVLLVNFLNIYDATPLHFACFAAAKKASDNIRTLLDAGARISLPWWRMTPFKILSDHKKTESVVAAMHVLRVHCAKLIVRAARKKLARIRAKRETAAFLVAWKRDALKVYLDISVVMKIVGCIRANHVASY
jgi:hypothetical protein